VLPVDLDAQAGRLPQPSRRQTDADPAGQRPATQTRSSPCYRAAPPARSWSPARQHLAGPGRAARRPLARPRRPTRTRRPRPACPAPRPRPNWPPKPQAVAELLAVCARGLPLPVRIVAARAARTTPHLPPRDAGRRTPRRLRPAGRTGRRGPAHETCGQHWPRRSARSAPPAASLFGFAGLSRPGPDISLPARRIPRRPPRRADEGSAARVGARLPGPAARPGPVPDARPDPPLRHRPSPTTSPRTPGEAALRRVLDFYTHTAHTADPPYWTPRVHRSSLTRPPPDAHPQPIPDVLAALAWFDIEHPGPAGRPTHRHEPRPGHPHRVANWPGTLHTFHYRQGHRHDRLWRVAGRAGRRSPTCPIPRHTSKPTGRSATPTTEPWDATRRGSSNLHPGTRPGRGTPRPRPASPHPHGARVCLGSARWRPGRPCDTRPAPGTFTAPVNQPEREAAALNVLGWCAGPAEQVRRRPQPTARPPSPCMDTTTAPRARRKPWTAWATSPHHTGDHQQAIDYYQQARTQLPGPRQHLQCHQYPSTGSATLMSPSASMNRPARYGGKPWSCTRNKAATTDVDRVRQQLDSLDRHLWQRYAKWLFGIPKSTSGNQDFDKPTPQVSSTDAAASS